MRRYTNKAKAERSDVGEISVEAERLAAAICVHTCADCRKEAQATLNNLARKENHDAPDR